MGWFSNLFGGGAKKQEREAKRLAEEARAKEQAREAAIQSGIRDTDATYAKAFNDNFYNKMRSSFDTVSRGQLDDQRSSANRDLMFHLSRNGLGNSSVMNEGQSDLQKQYARGLQDITSQGDDMIFKQKSMVEDSRSDIIKTLQATGDSNAAKTSAMNRVATLTQTPGFSPLADMFKVGAAQLGNQLQLERTAMEQGTSAPPLWTGAFGRKPGSSTINRR